MEFINAGKKAASGGGATTSKSHARYQLTAATLALAPGGGTTSIPLVEVENVGTAFSFVVDSQLTAGGICSSETGCMSVTVHSRIANMDFAVEGSLTLTATLREFNFPHTYVRDYLIDSHSADGTTTRGLSDFIELGSTTIIVLPPGGGCVQVYYARDSVTGTGTISPTPIDFFIEVALF